MDKEFSAAKSNQSKKKYFNVTNISDILQKKLELKNQKQANEAITDALNVKNKNERIKTAKKIIKLFPDCVGAYLLLARDDAKNLFDVRDYYEKAVLAAENLMKGISENFVFDMDEKAKYLVAKYSLSNVLWEIGEKSKAVLGLTDLLNENMNDEIGARYVLITWLIELQNDNECEKIFCEYNFDHSANFVYSHALYFYKNKRSFEAKKFLNEAFNRNIIIPEYILGFRRADYAEVEMIENEKEREAEVYSWDNYRVWHAVDGACTWLKGEYDIYMRKSKAD